MYSTLAGGVTWNNLRNARTEGHDPGRGMYGAYGRYFRQDQGGYWQHHGGMDTNGNAPEEFHQLEGDRKAQRQRGG